MMTINLRSVAAALACCAALACTEPNRHIVPGTSTPVLEARLELSQPTPRVDSEFTVTLQLRGDAAASVSSFTARIAYDSLGLKFLGDGESADAATRIANPQAGMLRVAGIAPEGFTGGKLYVARFSVLRADAASSLRLLVDEMHNTSHADVATSLTTGTP